MFNGMGFSMGWVWVWVWVWVWGMRMGDEDGDGVGMVSRSGKNDANSTTNPRRRWEAAEGTQESGQGQQQIAYDHNYPGPLVRARPAARACVILYGKHTRLTAGALSTYPRTGCPVTCEFQDGMRPEHTRHDTIMDQYLSITSSTAGIGSVLSRE